MKQTYINGIVIMLLALGTTVNIVDGAPPAPPVGIPAQGVGADVQCPEGYNTVQLLTYPVQTKCVCTGSDCPSANVEDSENVVSSIRIIESTENTGSGILQSANVSAEYSREITVEGSQLVMKTSAGSKDINVLPEQAIKISETSDVSLIQRIELNEESEKPVYSVYGEKAGKLFGLFSVTLNIETRIDAKTGDVISVRKPWWRFFAW